MKENFNQKDISFDIDLENIKQDTITTKIPQRNKDKKQTEIIPNIEDPKEANKEQVLYKCPNCSRTFKREAYAKHVPICARVFQAKKEDESKKKDIKEIKGMNEKKGNTKSKWESQSNELRALIHNKRAEKDKINNNKDIKIEIEEPKKHIDNFNNDIGGTGSPVNSNLQIYKKDGKIFIQCDLCNKKFTKINYESHLNDCKKKYKDKNNGVNKTYNKANIINNINNNINNNQLGRKPMMPAVIYGSNKPKFNMKFKK